MDYEDQQLEKISNMLKSFQYDLEDRPPHKKDIEILYSCLIELVDTIIHMKYQDFVEKNMDD